VTQLQRSSSSRPCVSSGRGAPRPGLPVVNEPATSTIRYVLPVPPLTSAGELLRQARRRSGLTQAQLGQRAGVGQGVVSVYEAGHRQPSVPVLLELVAASGHVLDVALVPAPADPAGVPPAGRPRPLSGPLGRRLRRRRQELVTTAAAHGVPAVEVLGSVARGTDRPGDPTELLVQLPPGAGLLALGRLQLDLEELLGGPVELQVANGLPADVRAALTAGAFGL